MPEGVAMGEEAEQLAREMYQFCVSSDIDIRNRTLPIVHLRKAVCTIDWLFFSAHIINGFI